MPAIMSGRRKGALYKSKRPIYTRPHKQLRRQLIPKIYNFKRTVDLGNINASSAADVLGVMFFKLNDMSGYTEFTSLFDQYKIYKVKVQWFPLQTQATVGAASAVTPFILTAVDYDDKVAPASGSVLLEYANMRTHSFFKNFAITLRPKPQLTAITQTGGATGVALAPNNVWLDAASSSVEHYGFKYCIPQVSANNIAGWRLIAHYFVTLKNVR